MCLLWTRARRGLRRISVRGQRSTTTTACVFPRTVTCFQIFFSRGRGSEICFFTFRVERRICLRRRTLKRFLFYLESRKFNCCPTSGGGVVDTRRDVPPWTRRRPPKAVSSFAYSFVFRFKFAVTVENITWDAHDDGDAIRFRYKKIVTSWCRVTSQTDRQVRRTKPKYDFARPGVVCERFAPSTCPVAFNPTPCTRTHTAAPSTCPVVIVLLPSAAALCVPSRYYYYYAIRCLCVSSVCTYRRGIRKRAYIIIITITIITIIVIVRRRCGRAAVCRESQ